MSLTTSGVGATGGGATGGLVLGHQANAVGQPPQPPPQAADSGHGAPPPSGAVLGADLHDRQHLLSVKQVKNLSHLPIVAIDLHASEPHLAMYPPKPEDPSESVPPKLVGKMKAHVLFKASEASHKTLRKYLTKSKPYSALLADSITKSGDKNAVEIDKPQRWLGLRRLEDAPDVLLANVKTDANSAPAIAEESSQEPGFVLTNSTLDGSPQPQNDDFDRVVAKVRLAASKKALTMLPEEAVQLILHQAQYHVAVKTKAENDEDEILDYPCAVAVPAWASHDASMEAYFDATGSSGVFFQRSICALAGALLPNLSGKANPVLERLKQVRAAMSKDFQLRKIEDPDAIPEEDVLLILFGITDEGFEATAVQISSLQTDLITCLFGNFKVLSNVSYLDGDPLSKMETCSKELEAAVDTIAPEADGPAGIITYGTAAEQEKIRKKWGQLKSSQEEWSNVPIFSTKADAVAMGAAVLGAVTHGRQSVLVEKGDKVKAELGIRVQNVAPAAVGIQINYHDGAAGKWTPVKTIFDFDRRIPAGPYSMDLKAAECVVYRNGSSGLSEEAFLKAVKENEGSKNIPQREEAALALKVQVVQKWTRDGEWKKVGDALEPLIKKPDPDDDEKKEACESVCLEISLGVTGMITTNLVGDRQSVVQATKSARNSALRYYVGIILAVLFFGGFLARSYWEEYSFKRDVAKLLAYYKHVIPGSISDGDEHNAMHIVWRYRSKKKKLWMSLEKKYGVPVREANEWDDYEGEEADDQGDTHDLDDEEEVKDKKESGSHQEEEL